MMWDDEHICDCFWRSNIVWWCLMHFYICNYIVCVNVCVCVCVYMFTYVHLLILYLYHNSDTYSQAMHAQGTLHVYRVQLCCRRSCTPRAVSCRSGFEATFLKRLCKIFLWMSKMGQSINACSSSSVVCQNCQDSAFFLPRPIHSKSVKVGIVRFSYIPALQKIMAPSCAWYSFLFRNFWY